MPAEKTVGSATTADVPAAPAPAAPAPAPAPAAQLTTPAMVPIPVVPAAPVMVPIQAVPRPMLQIPTPATVVPSLHSYSRRDIVRPVRLSTPYPDHQVSLHSYPKKVRRQLWSPVRRVNMTVKISCIGICKRAVRWRTTTIKSIAHSKD